MMRTVYMVVNACFIAASCGSAEQSHVPNGKLDAGQVVSAMQRAGDWAPLDPDMDYAGKTRAEWAVEWMRWSFSQTSCDSSNFDPDGSLCRLYQDASDSPTFFMAYAPSDHPRTRCTVPSGRALLVPLANFFADDGGSAHMRTPEELEAAATKVLESMRDLKLRVDGKKMSQLERYVVRPTEYSYSVPAEPNWYSCNGFSGVSNTIIQPAVVTGYFVLLPPPPVGEHELEYGGVMTFDGEEYSLSMYNHFEVVED